VGVGATLAAARRRAGLTIDDVSRRTRVRQAIILGIERDDYAACGGDFYARGHIRAIAQAVGEDPAPLLEEFDSTWGSAEQITAAEAFRPRMPLRARERRRVRWAAVLAAAVLAVIGFASYKLVAAAGRAGAAAAVSTRHPGSAGRPGGTPGPSPAGSGTAVGSAPAPASASPAPARTPSPAATPAAELTPASVAAFGPGGGDDPQQAALALSGNPATPWRTDWYTTPEFGNLYDGTGLLVDMGRPVTVTSVRLSLGGNPGADLELRAGPSPSDLTTVARSSGAGGTVLLSLSPPAHARYLVVWFTRLPPDSAGTYQASIYDIAVRGRA
jgi:transcriptional regulator with XRE-family HTH domain